MMMSPIRIGVLGAGYFGTLHALTVNSLSEAQPVSYTHLTLPTKA